MAWLLTLFFLLLLSCGSRAQSIDPVTQYCDQSSNISKTSQISSNIDRLLPVLVSETKSKGFIATSYGSNSNKVYGLAQCRGDVSRSDCATCIGDAANQIRKLCPNQADARIWYDYCFLRYDTDNFIGQLDTSYGYFLGNTQNASDPEDFKQKLGALMNKVKDQAVQPKNGGLGKGQTKLSPFATLYALGQCTRDLPPIFCAQCLAIAVENVFPGFCAGRKGCRVLYSSCYVRYELYPFFFPLDVNATKVNALRGERSVAKAVYP